MRINLTNSMGRNNGEQFNCIMTKENLEKLTIKNAIYSRGKASFAFNESNKVLHIQNISFNDYMNLFVD